MFATSKYTPSTTLPRAKNGYNAKAKRYSYRFNGKELDKEGLGGGGSTYDYGFRIYNAQLGKFLSVDPLTKSYPWYTPFQFAGNMTICAIDLDGLEEFVVIRWWDGDDFKGVTVTYLPNAENVRRYNSDDKKVLIVNRPYNEDELNKIKDGDIFTINNNQEIVGLKREVQQIFFTNTRKVFKNSMENEVEKKLGMVSINFFNNRVNDRTKKILSISLSTLEIPKTIHFNENGDNPMQIDPNIVQNYNNFLAENPDYMVNIQGFTDAKGSTESNVILGKNRINEVARKFIGSGIDSRRITFQNHGESRATVSENETSEARQPDRKVKLNWQPKRN